MPRHHNYRTYTKEEKIEMYFKAVYLFVNSKDKRVTEIAKNIGYGADITHRFVNEYIDKGFKELVLARDTKTMESFVSICLEDDSNKK